MKTYSPFELKLLPSHLLAALVVLFITILATSPALAGKSVFTAKASANYALIPPADSPEPAATGKCNLQWVGVDIKPVQVTLSCRGLTPGKQYSVVVHHYWVESSGWYYHVWDFYEEHLLTADARGRLIGQFTSGAYIYQFNDLWIENDVGQVVLERQQP